MDFVKLMEQVDGVAMGSPLGLMLANAFLAHFEKNWLQNFPFDLKHYYYRQYVDDIFVFFYLTKTFKSLPKLFKWPTG